MHIQKIFLRGLQGAVWSGCLLALLLQGKALAHNGESHNAVLDSAQTQNIQSHSTQSQSTQSLNSQPSTAMTVPTQPNSAAATWGETYFPNVPLITHQGQRVNFYEDLVKDKVVVINFIFTSCSEVCPLETAQLKRVKQLLGERVGQDVFMYSITIDPHNDTPEVLQRYAETYDVGPGWYFLTGQEADIILLRKKLGLYIEEIQGENSTDHNLNLIIGNQKTGRWMKRSPFENPYVLATQIGSWLHNWKLPGQPKQQRDYAEAPKLRSITSGESLYRTRCASCHTIGAQGMAKARMERLGPDLLGVTQRRERDWLVRWLAAPDEMLAQQDPIALELLATYKLPMPNLSLNQQDIDALLEYIEQESLLVQGQAQNHALHDQAKDSE